MDAGFGGDSMVEDDGVRLSDIELRQGFLWICTPSLHPLMLWIFLLRAAGFSSDVESRRQVIRLSNLLQQSG